MHLDHAVVRYSTNYQRLRRKSLVGLLSPRDRRQLGVSGPGLRVHHQLRRRRKSAERPRHRPDGRGHVILALYRHLDASIGHPGALEKLVSAVRCAASWPGLLTEGFRPQSPFMWHGMRIEPPMSVPQPITEPPSDSKAASPPVEPPGVSFGLDGWVVKPQSGLSVSPHCFR